MNRPPRRRKGDYFIRLPRTPAPVEVCLRRRISFSEVDPMGVLWHGRYAQYFEQANEELGRKCGMSYADFTREKIRAPVVQFHVDYFASPLLGEEIRIVGRLVWNEGARIDIEYELWKPEAILAATGYTVQMLTSDNGQVMLVSPSLLERCRQRWRKGEFQ